MLSITATLVVNHWQTQSAQAAFAANFQQQAHDQVAAIHREINAQLLATHALSALYLASTQVTRAEFHRFARTLLDNIPSLQALEWIPEISESQRNHWEASHHSGRASPITERDSQGRLIPAAHRPRYYPVELVEPVSGNHAAIGFDLASEAVRREALERARDQCAIAVSGPIALVQEPASPGEPQAAFLSFIPIYRPPDSAQPLPDASPGSPQERRRQLLGFVLAVARIGDLVEFALAPLSTQDIDLQLTDITETGVQQALYHHHPTGYQASEHPTAAISTHFDLSIAGRQWRITASPMAGRYPNTITADALTTLLSGLLLTLLLTLYIATLQRHTRRLSRLSQQQQLLSQCNHSLARAMTEQQLLDAYCRILVQQGPYQQAHIDYPTPPIGGNPAACARQDKPASSDPGKPRRDRQPSPTSLALPLIAGEQKLGTLQLQCTDRPCGNDELTLLTDIAAGLAFGIATRRAREAEKQHLRRLREDVEHEQRSQLAATLHDGAGQSVQAINLGLKRLRNEPDAASNHTLLNTLIDEAGTIIDEFRDISRELRPLTPHHRDLRDAIQRHCDTLSWRSHIPIDCTLNADVGDLPDRTQQQCFLAFREALSNALRHANASQIDIRLTRHPQTLQLTINDNGSGFDTRTDTGSPRRHPAGLGLSMIEERCHSIGATTNIRSQPGSGTSVIISIPIPETARPGEHTDHPPGSNPFHDSGSNPTTISADGQPTGQTASPA